MSRSRSPAGGGGASGSTRSTGARSSARRNSQPGPGRRHRARAPLPVRPSCSGSGAALRRRGDPRAGPAQAAARPLAAAGRSARADRRDSPSAGAERRLRRAHVAPSPRRACRRPRIPLADRRPPRRVLRLRRRTSSAPRSLDGAGLRGERRAVIAGIVLGEDEGLSESCARGFAPRASTTCWPYRVRTSRSSRVARSCSRPDRGLALCSARSAHWPRSPATCSRSAGSPRSCGQASQDARLACVARGEAE